MIITVTLNPAVDKTIIIDNFTVGKVNRVASARVDAGGKGINVSNVLKSMGENSKALGLLAGNNGQFIKECLDSSAIENDFLFIDGETRTNIKIVDNVNHMNTDINESGPLVSQKNIDELNKRLLETMQNCSVLVLTGSLPQNVDRGIYGLWAEKAKQSGVKVVIDAERDVLKHGIEASPYVVKPNIFELEELFGQKTDCIDDVVKLAQRIFEYDVKIVVVSLGEKGALFVKRDAIILAQAISVNPKSTVGAGDSMVAALTLAIEKNYDFEKAVKLAVACGTASVMTPGTQAADMDTILEYEKQVSFEYLQ